MTTSLESSRPNGETRLGIGEIWRPYSGLVTTPTDGNLGMLTRNFTLQTGDLPELPFMLFFRPLSPHKSTDDHAALQISAPRGLLSKHNLIETYRKAYLKQGTSAAYGDEQKRLAPHAALLLNNLILNGTLDPLGISFQVSPQAEIEFDMITFPNFNVTSPERVKIGELNLKKEHLLELPSLELLFSVKRNPVEADRVGRLLSFLDDPS
jgi:hypothetical protein